jgi:hypothetical protein
LSFPPAHFVFRLQEEAHADGVRHDTAVVRGKHVVEKCLQVLSALNHIHPVVPQEEHADILHVSLDLLLFQRDVEGIDDAAFPPHLLHPCALLGFK